MKIGAERKKQNVNHGANALKGKANLCSYSGQSEPGGSNIILEMSQLRSFSNKILLAN